MAFKLTNAQLEAQALISGSAEHIMLFGGSRSGKTFLHVRTIVFRALAALGSRHLIARFRFNAVNASIILDTFPNVMEKCFPGVTYKLDRKDWYAEFPNGSQIFFAGLDDKERAEKILGMEFATVFLNECSQIPFSSRNLVVTRLAQKVLVDATQQQLRLKFLYDENPPTKGHWTYNLFVKKVDPESKQPLGAHQAFAAMQINPEDNLANLPPGYMATLQGLSARLQRRFLLGDFADENPDALFNDSDIDKWRVLDGELPDMVRIVIAVDPSGASGAPGETNDAIGIIVMGLGINGIGYVLEDLTVTAAPGVWGKIATDSYDRWEADMIVGEGNFGGAMVRHVIQTARPKTPFMLVSASRGKAVRAEPISALYENGKIRHVGYFRELEDELCGFSTKGYMGEGSPNRADAAVWAATHLFPGHGGRRQAKKAEQASGVARLLDGAPLWSG